MANAFLQAAKPHVQEQRQARLAGLKTEPLQFNEIFQVNTTFGSEHLL